MVDLQELQARIEVLIPITRALGLRLSSFDGHVLRVSAPLAPNHNHQQTAFGGSLYCAGVFGAWALLQIWLEQKNIPGNIVIQTGTMDYVRPVSEDFETVTSLPQMDRVEVALRRRGKARLDIVSDIMQRGEVQARLTGRFVIVMPG